MLRVHTMPGHLAKDIERGLEAQREHARQKAKLEAERAELAEAVKRQVSAEEYTKRRREREAEEAQTAAAQQALREAVDAYLTSYASIVAGLRQAAEGTAAALAEMKRIGQWAASLSADGRQPDATNTLQLATDLSLLIPRAYKDGVPSHKFRLGVLEWPSAADAKYPPGADHVEAERQRLTRHILPLCKG